MVFCNLTVDCLINELIGHNPYFNRWFSAINIVITNEDLTDVTILILIDGFLQ